MKTLGVLSAVLGRFSQSFIGGLVGGLLAAWLFTMAALHSYDEGVFAGSSYCISSKSEAGEVLLSCTFPPEAQ